MRYGRLEKGKLCSKLLKLEVSRSLTHRKADGALAVYSAEVGEEIDVSSFLCIIFRECVIKSWEF
jgi:hypothetical protein